ncbi:MAG TPA: type 4a pilus biogenesis protein PilO [Thermoanaerobaculia bacterium]|nr:type 4a pilus biogenesis protein PilO [Thermoanaerobaculia bacterium]
MALTLDDKPWWVGLIIGIVLAVAAVFGVEYAFVKDYKEEIATADAEIIELDKKIAAGHAAEQKLPQFREEVKRLELELEKLRRILPSSRNTEEIIKKVKSLVDQGDFGLIRLAFPDIAKVNAEDPYAEWPISCELIGRYHDLAILFNRLGNFSRIMNVEDINIGALPSQVDRTIRSTFVAKTFVYVEPVEPPPAPAAKKPGGGDE